MSFDCLETDMCYSDLLQHISKQNDAYIQIICAQDRTKEFVHISCCEKMFLAVYFTKDNEIKINFSDAQKHVSY